MEQLPSNRGGEQERGPVVQHFQFGPWVFNVSGARAIIAERPRDLQALDVESWAYQYGLDDTDAGAPLFSNVGLDRDYAMTTDLDEPVIVATVRTSEHGELRLLIDGTHRLYKAHVQGVAELPAYMLNAEESLVIREDGFFGTPEGGKI
jgi:hypothetical protein